MIGLGIANNNIILAEKIQSYHLDTSTKNLLFTSLPFTVLDKQLSNYSVKQESQSDRVGLYLMIRAGYDPREAPEAWKMMYSRYGIAGNNNNILSLTTSDKILTGIYQLQKPSLSSISQITLNELGKSKVKSMSLESRRTHPDNIKRFEQLNKFIAMYWSEGGQLNKLSNYSDRWITTMKLVNKELERSWWNAVYIQTKDPFKRIALINTALARKYEPRFFYKERAVNNMTHLGSGSSRIAAYELGFDFLGIEINQTHFHNQEVRFKNHLSQLKLNFNGTELQ